MDNTVAEVKKHLFMLGFTVVTAGVTHYVENNGLDVSQYVFRHVTGDWGDLCDTDKASNNEAIYDEGMILSAYHIPELNNLKIYVITNDGHKTTTVLLPNEY